MYAQASSWTEEDMRRLNGAARAASDRRPDLAAAEAMGGAAGFWVENVVASFVPGAWLTWLVPSQPSLIRWFCWAYQSGLFLGRRLYANKSPNATATAATS